VLRVVEERAHVPGLQIDLVRSALAEVAATGVEQQLGSIGRPLRHDVAGAVMGDPLDLPARRRHKEDVVTTVAVRAESDALAIGREPYAAVVCHVDGETSRHPLTLLVQVSHP